MKTMTCKKLGGACDVEFHAKTFEEMAEVSKRHAHEMYKKSDKAHMKAMKEMMELMKDSSAMKKWFEGKRKEFDKIPDGE
jgi:hypothetical protein